MKNSFLGLFNRYKFYVSTGVLFVIWISFFDHANLVNQLKLWYSCRDLESKVTYYQEELEKVKKDKKELMGSMAALETFGRERYLMKKEGETVFVLVDEEGELLEEY